MLEREEKIESFLKLSQSHKSRTKEESECLYAYIQSLLADVNSKEDKLIKSAIDDLLLLFNPIILKFSSYYYTKVKDMFEYEDVLQEGYCIFISCVYNYNKDLSSFPYFIKDNFPRYFHSWAKNVWKHSDKINDEPFVDQAHPLFDDDDKVFSRLLEDLFKREYEGFITKLSNKYSKTITYKTVCDDYFLGGRSCKDISEGLGISYHAVYDCICKIKRDLNYFIKNNVNFDFYFGSDNEVILKKDGF